MQSETKQRAVKIAGPGGARRTILRSLVVLFVIAALAFGLTSILRTNLESAVLDGSVQGADLIGTLGGQMPDLTPRRMERGLSAAQIRRTDQALGHAQREGALTSLLVINASSEIVYSPNHSLIGTVAPPDPGISSALADHDSADRSMGSSNPLDVAHGPALDAYVPVQRQGKIVGALDLSQPLGPFTARVDSAQSGYYLVIGGGGLLLWLLSFPIARLAERNFEPGRRRRLRELRLAIQQRKLEVHYQPIVQAHAGRLVGVEALVRWRRGSGLVPPDEFLPLAESSGLIEPLTAFVLDEAVKEAAAWRRDGHPVFVAVNVSAWSLLESRLASEIEETLARHSLPAHLLHIEITETAVIEDESHAIAVLETIAASGVQVSLDDFGTGYSSMTRVGRLPITELKIDRSFVSDLTPARYPLVRSMIDLAHVLGLRVVAEGVEDHATLVILREMGCELVQGFYFSRPLPAAELKGWRTVPPITSEESPELQIEANLDGYFTKVTDGFQRCLGVSREELTTVPYIELVHPDDREATAGAAVALLDEGAEIVHFENRLRGQDGAWHRLLWSARSDGRTIYAIARELSPPTMDDKSSPSENPAPLQPVLG